MKDQVVSETTVSREQVALMAYEVWEKAGRPHGRDWEFWFEAERQLHQPMAQTVTPPTAPSQPLLATTATSEHTLRPVPRIEPARIPPASARPARKATRKSPGILGGRRGRA